MINMKEYVKQEIIKRLEVLSIEIDECILNRILKDIEQDVQWKLLSKLNELEDLVEYYNQNSDSKR